jgi:hypothetical protein
MRHSVLSDKPGPIYRKDNRQILCADIVQKLVVAALQK